MFCFSGADLRSLLEEACYFAMDEYELLRDPNVFRVSLDAKEEANSSSSSSGSPYTLHMRHFISALEKIRPSVSEEVRFVLRQLLASSS